MADRTGIDSAISALRAAVDEAFKPVVQPPPVVEPPKPGTIKKLNLLLRGQSNALLFADFGGIWELQKLLAAQLGVQVNVLFAYGKDKQNTIHSGTEFVAQWMNNGTEPGHQEQQLLDFIHTLPASSKEATWLDLWMHNESDQKISSLSTAAWVRSVMADMQLVRAVLGLPASQAPRLFVPIRYNWGSIDKIKAGMEQLAADPANNCGISWVVYSDAIRMNYGGGAANTEHMSKEDAMLAAKLLAPEIVKFLKGSTSTPLPDTAPYARFLDFPAFQAKEAVLHVQTNTPLKWTLFADKPNNYPWYGSPQDVPADGAISVKAVADGDKVKVFTPDFRVNVDSLPFKFTTATVPPPVSGTNTTVDAFLHGLHGGPNIEREMMWEMSQDEHNWLRQQVPFDCARVFLPWRIEGGMAGNDRGAWQLPSDGVYDRFVDGLHKMRKAGYRRVFADGYDVLAGWEMRKRGDSIPLIRQHLEKFGQKIAASQLPPDFLAVGPINEWATEQHEVHELQDDFMGILRRHLPQHLLIFGCDYWKYWGKLIEGTGYQVPKDALSFCDTHSYKAMDAQGWNWLMGELTKWQQRTGRRIIFGEAGPGEGNEGEQYHLFPNNLRVMCPITRPIVPMPWAVNKGKAWRLNSNGASLYNGTEWNGAPDIKTALREGLGY